MVIEFKVFYEVTTDVLLLVDHWRKIKVQAVPKSVVCVFIMS